MTWKQLKHFCSGPAEYGLNVPSDAYVAEGIRLLRTTDIQDGGTITHADQGVFVDPAIVAPRHQLAPGDLLFSRAGSLGRCYRVRPSDGPLTFAGYLVRFRPAKDADPRYLAYCASAAFFQAAIAADAITSTISNFNAERYAGLRVPDRELADQCAVADFLDKETERIEALIAKKRRMIDLLRERWLNEVRTRMRGLAAEHGWIDLKRLVQCLDGKRVPLSAEERDTRQGEYPYFGASGQIDSVDDYLFNETLVLLGEDGAQLADPDYEIAMVVSGPIWVNNHAHVLRPVSVDPLFLSMHLSTVDRALVLSGATREKITQADMNEIPVPAAPRDVQLRVSGELQRRRSHLQALEKRMERQIALLQEHRQALITAAVRGKLKMPGVAA